MQINLGAKIRELRKRDSRTQENLADALGVTSQAVSRWEANKSYPDMEIIPSIANYFGITIDELFGYQNDRENKINQIIEQANSFNIKGRSDDNWINDCIAILREGLAEFPQNEKLLITYADALTEAGYRKYKEWTEYDEEGFMHHCYEQHRNNEYWSEAIKTCEQLIKNATDNLIINDAIGHLVLLYKNIGEIDKAIYYANKMPSINNSKELMLISATDEKTQAKYIGEFLTKAVNELAEQIVYGLMINKNHYNSDLPINKIKGVISFFDLIFDDGNMGKCHDTLIKLYLYLSRLEWERGYQDDAFKSLDNALYHAKKLESICDGNEHSYTAPLVSFVKYNTNEVNDIAKYLPDDWPFWFNPDFSNIEKDIKSDARWTEWVLKTQE